MTIKEFIQKAIQGGWGNFTTEEREKAEQMVSEPLREMTAAEILLDPLAWQAVGKVEGWGVTDRCWGCNYSEGPTDDTPIWKVKWHQMLDALAEGKTIEQYLETL